MNDAYTAGIIDGEGTITIANQDGYYYLRVNVTMSDKGYRVLDFLHREYGGMMGKERPSSGNTRASKQWRVSNGDAARVINSVLNHLRLKREQALVALQLWDLIEEAPKKSNGRTEWSDSMKASAEVLKRRIGELNARGVNVPEPQVVHEGAVAVWKYGEWHELEDDLFGPVPFKGRLPVSGSMRNGVVYEHRMLAHHINGSGFSFSPPDALLRTPCAAEADGGPLHPDVAAERGQTLRLTGQILAMTGDLLPTPVAQPSGNTPEDHLRKKPGRDQVTDLAIIVESGLLESGGRLLPTPRSNEANGVGRHGTGGDDLRTTVSLLPTPNTMEHLPARTGEARERQLRRGEGPEASRRESMGNLREDIVEVPAGSWGPYAAAIHRWERVMGRDAPEPTEEGPKGGRRLSAAFVEWLMGLPGGWVTDTVLGLSRVQQLRALGNGVVTQQAILALALAGGKDTNT